MMDKLSNTGLSLPINFSHLRSQISGMSQTRLMLGAVLFAIGFLRLFSDFFFKSSDLLLVQPGDSLLVVTSLLVIAAIYVNGDEASKNQVLSLRPLDDILESHLNLDAAIGKKLIEVIEDTENSALKIISEVRQLYDVANHLVIYMDESSLTAETLSHEVVAGVEHLRGIENFTLNLPAQMNQDLINVQLISNEIRALSDLVGSVKAISMQSHLLSINAAIEGSRAGPSGASFRVVAGEMRKLASNSNEVANQISQGLLRANRVVTEGIESSIAEASQRLEEVLAAADSIQKLQDNFTGISDFYKSRFSVITQHNKDLALNISEVLGQIQYQDVVSQCVNRMMAAMNQRNALLEDSNLHLQQGNFERDNLTRKLDFILQTYLMEEERHKHSARHEEVGGGDLKIELF